MKNHRIASHVGVGVLSVALGWYLGQRDGATPGPTETHALAKAAPAHRATLAAGDAGPTSAERGATTDLPRPPPAPQAAATAPPDGTVSGNETAAKDRPDTPQAARQNTEANDAATAWRNAHRAELAEIIAGATTPENAKFLEGAIAENSEFLNNSASPFDDQQNEDWAYAKEAEILGLVHSHPLSGSVEVLSLLCRQLMCELTLAGVELPIHELQQTFYTNMRDLLPPRGLDGPMAITARTEAGEVHYQVLDFSP